MDLQEPPSSNESTDGKLAAITSSSRNTSSNQAKEDLGTETTEDELEVWTLPSEIRNTNKEA
jgi:hypothetical protein